MPTTREMINPTTGITPATIDKIDNTGEKMQLLVGNTFDMFFYLFSLVTK